ncbi:hypothetical protein B0A49_01049 [Cryomyces minteri]|uniref:Fungal lipase-type domain-containing protein n=1 Tax=Cryomyces minteri TaxID=331657 RepID=A0A4V5NHZ0_9PEZI|nr:hypothetical protein B0A49_01049 [Cryomyces minteri]
MTFKLFERKAPKRKQSSQKSSPPQALTAWPQPQPVYPYSSGQNIYHPAQTTLYLPANSPPPPYSVRPHAPSPANNVWRAPPSEPYGYSVAPPQSYLPLQAQKTGKSARHDQKVKWGMSSTTLAVPHKPQKTAWKYCTNLATTLVKPVATPLAATKDGGCQLAGYLNQGAALCDLISSKLNDVITSIDGEIFGAEETELVVYQGPLPLYYAGTPDAAQLSRSLRPAAPVVATSTNHFSKVWLYANSRLPPHLPPFKVYIPTYQLLCLAAQYSERAYARPSSAERETHVEADWRLGTKAMVLRSVAMDDMNTVVFAIRGSQTFMDWAVNFRPAPASPQGFLDDPGNLCHSGFLSVAKSMVKPVAARLRALLSENPARKNCSLLITGHSAGGAVASLLFMHMMAETARSELTELTSAFKRVHCVTFGTLPLQKPASARHRKSLFFSFVNEGDPVARADKAFQQQQQQLANNPNPNPNSSSHTNPPNNPSGAALPVWKVPEAKLSNAGRLVLLRELPRGSSGGQTVLASQVTDEMLRGVSAT